ncbi:hypothetical protein SH2C18_34850 [Clostridium sediminicola]|uniref:hypothetical protein n=1 Tax=Clostridium sediminicola TaxID=3114879 RepID=UPI0031F1F69E
MRTYYCNPKWCDKKETCNLHIIKHFGSGEKIAEDMSDICLPKYRLYIEGDFYKAFPNKYYFTELLNFYDNICPGEGCGKREIYYKRDVVGPSKIECKLGEKFTCEHSKHPDNEPPLCILKDLKEKGYISNTDNKQIREDED